MWEPTTIECRIATAVLNEYADILGGKLPPCRRASGAWDADKFLHNVFTLLAEMITPANDGDYGEYDPLSYRQHCAFWHVVKDYEWKTLGEYKEIIEVVTGVIDSAQQKYESRWMEWEGRYVRKELAKNLKELAARRAELLSAAPY
jgi:hypothetical protein